MAYFDPIQKIFYGREIPRIYSSRATLGQVLYFNFFRNPFKVIQECADDGITITCQQMSQLMMNIAKNLSRLGYRQGDVAGLMAATSTYVTPAIFGCYTLGLPVSPLDVAFDVNQIVQIFRETKPKVVLCDAGVVEKVQRALELLMNNARIVILTERLDRFMHITDLTQTPTEHVQLSMDLGEASEVCAAILSTSGSTNIPKLVQLTHAQLLHVFNIGPFYEDTSVLNFSTVFWLSGFITITSGILNNHKRLITSQPFTPDVCFDLIEAYKITQIFLVAPHISLLMESPRFKTADLSSIRVFTTSGVYASEQLRRRLQEKLPNGRVMVCYGVSEVGAIAETFIGDAISASVGKPTNNTQVKILIDDGTIGGPHEVGEVLVKRPSHYLGYLNNLHPSILDNEGWIHTGDMGFVDDKPELHIVGQRPFIIKNFYNEIFPMELEEIIEEVPGVRQAVVVGTPDSVDIEIPTAFVVRAPDSEVTKETIVNATSHLPRFKHLRGGVFFVDSLPLTPSGNVQRRIVKEMANQMGIMRAAQ